MLWGCVWCWSVFYGDSLFLFVKLPSEKEKGFQLSKADNRCIAVMPTTLQQWQDGCINHKEKIKHLRRKHCQKQSFQKDKPRTMSTSPSSAKHSVYTVNITAYESEQRAELCSVCLHQRRTEKEKHGTQGKVIKSAAEQYNHYHFITCCLYFVLGMHADILAHTHTLSTHKSYMNWIEKCDRSHMDEILTSFDKFLHLNFKETRPLSKKP